MELPCGFPCPGPPCLLPPHLGASDPQPLLLPTYVQQATPPFSKCGLGRPCRGTRLQHAPHAVPLPPQAPEGENFTMSLVERLR